MCQGVGFLSIVRLRTLGCMGAYTVHKKRVCHKIMTHPRQERDGTGILMNYHLPGVKPIYKYTGLCRQQGRFMSFVADGLYRVKVGCLARRIPSEEYSGDGADGKRKYYGVNLYVYGPVGDDCHQP